MNHEDVNFCTELQSSMLLFYHIFTGHTRTLPDNFQNFSNSSNASKCFLRTVRSSQCICSAICAKVSCAR